MENLVNKYNFIFDGTMDDDENIIYVFASSGLELDDYRELFDDLYEEDIEEYASEHSISEEDFEITGCSIYLYVDKETEEVDEDFITLQPNVTYSDGETAELLGAFISLESETIEQLLNLKK